LNSVSRMVTIFVSLGLGTGLGAGAALGQAPVATQTQAPKPAGVRLVVVIDAAHGGDDGGAVLNPADGPDGGTGETTAEKTVTLGMSVRLRSLLMARGFPVVTTREGNLNLDSNGRAQIANRAALSGGAGVSGGAVCLSLHATEMGTGAHIFVSSLGPSAATKFLPWKTAQSAYVSRSLKLAGVVNSAFEHVTAGDAAIPATVGRASLPGVDSMTCPAVAIEIAPIRGADHKVVTAVTDADYQSKVVEALAAAMLEWKAEVDSGADGVTGVGGKTP
jgi:N-acetylmuramoyl-L-alanine amidase